MRWDPPRYHAVHRLLTNPVYAGAYVFGRTLSRTRVEGGRKVITHGVARRREDWTVLIRDHHDGYISWEDYDRNRAIIAGNASMKGTMVAGAVRNGSALLVGLLRCGRCGRKFKVLHHSRRDARYVCASHVDPSSEKGCTAFSNMRIDAAVSAEVLRAISPLAIEAALKLIAERNQASSEQLRQREFALEQARYEAKHARRQYDAVDPDNRLVAGELERRWNDCLATVARLEDQIRSLRNEEPSAVGEGERMTLIALAGDLPALWNDAAASIETRKRIMRAVLKEIIVTAETGRLHLALHWQGGDHTRLEVLKNRSGQNRFKTDAATEQLVCELARLLPDHSIAPVLNRLGIRSARGQTWTQLRVRNFRSTHHIPVYREGERAERRELVLHEAANRLGVSKMTVVRLIRDGMLPARQVCARAPLFPRSWARAARSRRRDAPGRRDIVAALVSRHRGSGATALRTRHL